MKMSKLFWGLLIIGAGVILLLSALGLGNDNLAMPIIGSAMLLAVSIASLTKFRYILFFIPLAFIAYIWRSYIGLAELGLWPLLGAAALLGIGLSVIFHKHSHHHHHLTIGEDHDDDHPKSEETLNDNESVNINSSWGENIKYIHAGNLKQASIYSSFAETKVFFDQCQASSEGLTINVDASFTELTLIVPRNWKIINHVKVFMGHITEPDNHPGEAAVTVELNGSINLGELKISVV
jgi:predicted membrane protein